MDKNASNTRVTLEHFVHGSQRCIATAFANDAKFIIAAKQAGAQWSAAHKRWYAPNTPEHLRAIFQAFKGVD